MTITPIPTAAREPVSARFGAARSLKPSLSRLDLDSQRVDSLLGLKSGGGGVQRKSATSFANEGFSGASSKVPHLKAMEKSFGGADFSGVRAHVGTPQAKAACESLGAEAYAMDGAVAFKSATPSQSLVAHELTHVLQQRGGGAAFKVARAIEEISVPDIDENEEEGAEEEEAPQPKLARKVSRSVARSGVARSFSDIDLSGEAEAEAVEAAVSSGRPAHTALKGVSAKASPALKPSLSRGPALAGKGGGGLSIDAESVKLGGKVSWKLPSAPIPIAAVPGLFLDFGASLNIKGDVSATREDKATDENRDNVTVQLGGSASVSAGLALGVPKVVMGGFYATAEAGIMGKYEKKGNGSFIGLEIAPAISCDVRITFGPGLWTYSYKLASVKLFTARFGWTNGRYTGATFDWSDEMKKLAQTIRAAWDKAKTIAGAAGRAVRSTGRAIKRLFSGW